MYKRTIALSAVFMLGVGGASAQQDPLQPLSRLELERTFGTTPAPRVPLPLSVAPGVTPESGPGAAAARSAAEDAARVLRADDPLDGIVALSDVAGPGSVDSNVLLAILKDDERPLRYLMLWHQIALDVTAIDHAPTAPGERHQQFGPARSARALALVHQAMFEAANAFSGNKYQSTLADVGPLDRADASEAAAITEAAYQTLAWLYPRLNEIAIHAAIPATGTVVAESVPISTPVCPVQPTLNLRTYYQCSLATVGDAAAREKGAQLGRTIAGEIRRLAAGDHSQATEPQLGLDFDARFPANTPHRALRQWERDPVSNLSVALGGRWSEVRPFALSSAYEFRPSEAEAPRIDVPAPTGSAGDDLLALIDAVKTLKSYNAVEAWGGDARLNAGGRTDQAQSAQDGFFLAQYWAYDATAFLCAPPRLYNQVATRVLAEIRRIDRAGPGGPDAALRAGRSPIDTRDTADVARFLALVNVAMADTAIAAWDAKYYYQFPRPVTVIRATQALEMQAESAVPPALVADAPGADDAAITELKSPGAAQVLEASVRPRRLPITDGPASAPLWFPAGAQVTNSNNPVNITPPFPAYVSGHAAFGGALFGVLRQYVGSTAEFRFRSDEFNGRNKDVFNYVRCQRAADGTLLDEHTPEKFCEPRQMTLDCAERENADSRLWMGVHWIDDADDGIVIGNQVARKVYGKLMRPTSGNLPSSPFAVRQADYAGAGNLREALTCPDLDLPSGWADEDGTVGFGELTLVDVAPAP